MLTSAPRSIFQGLVGMNSCLAVVLLSCISACFLLFQTRPASAQVDYQWNVAGPADWNNAANWTPAGGPPGTAAGDNAHIGNGGDATITSAAGTTLGIDSLLFDGVAGGQVDQSSDTLALSGSEADANPAGAGRLRIGAVNAGAFGTYNLTGTGIVTATRIQVGETGGGAAPVSTFNQGVIGDAGTTSVTTTQSLNIGGAAGGAVGHGIYNLNSGTLTVPFAGGDDRSLSIGNNVGSVGVMNMYGAATTLTSQQMQIGNGGNGTFNQHDGTATFNSGGAKWFALGGSANGTSGGVGNGTYNLSGGTVNMNSWLFIGANNGAAGTSTGTFNVSGASTVVNSSWINVGRDTNGFVNQSDGTVHVTNRMLIGDNLASANGTYTISGGTLDFPGASNFIIGNNGTGNFIQTGGTVTDVNANHFGMDLGAANAGNGNYTMRGGTLDTNSAIHLGNGTNSVGTFNQSGGHARTALNGAWVTVGQGTGSTGTFNMSGGSFDVNTNADGGDGTNGQLHVGFGANSTGVVNQTGGVISTGHQVTLGWGAGATGTYNISGATSGPNATVLNASQDSDQGIVLGWGNGTGVFNQSGGVVNVLHGTLQFGQASTGVTTSTGTYNLSGGILNTPLIQKSFAGNTATFNFNGGTLSPTASAGNFMQGLNAANVQAGGAVIDTNSSVITISQPLLHSGAGTDGGLTLTDSNTAATGNLTLTGANTYNGTTRVINSAGALGPATLFLGSALAVQNSTVQMTSGLNNSVQFVGGIGAFTFGGLTGSANLSLTDGGSSPVTLSVGNNNLETTYTGALGTAADGANLIKIGSGTLHLTGTQLYSGTTTINGGTLSLNGASASLANSSSVDVGGANATGSPTLLARSGANAGAVHVHGAETTGVPGTIAAGDINTFNAASLTLDAGANTTFVLGTPGVGGAGVTADLIAVSNALTLPAAGSVVVNLIDNANAGGLGSFGTGTYKLITESMTTNFANTKFGIGVGIPGFQEAFSNPGGKEIDLVVTPAPTWKAVAVDTNWANAANWVNGLVPGVHDGTTINTDLAAFTTASNILNPAPDMNRNLQNITFDQAAAGAYVIGTTGGNALLMTAGGTIQTTALITKTETINAPLVLEGANGSYAFSSNAPSTANVLLIGGGITGGAAGNTVLTLTGGNTGNNTISGVIGDGSATTLALVKSGAGAWVLNKTEANTGGTTILGGTLQLGDGMGNGSVIGPISDGGSLRVANPNPQTISNAISGGGTLTAAGAGLLTLTNTNSVSGLTTINGGSSLQLGDGVTNNGSVGGNILDNGSLTFANPTDLAYAGAIGGNGPVTMSGPGTLTLSGASTYGGSTTMSANVTLTSAVAANILPSTTAVTMSGAAALDMSGVVSDQTIGSLGSASAATSVNLGTNNLITGGNGNNTTFAGSISGTGGVVKNGGGTFTLSNANSYSGATAINAGAVQLNHANAAQDSTVTIGVDNGLKFGSGVHTFNVGGLAGAGNLSLTDTAATAVTLNAGSNATDSAYSGVLSGAGGILGKTGSGTLTLSGNNSYSGGTTISSGTLSATTTNTVLGAGPVTMSGGRLQLTGGLKNAIGINFEGATGQAPTLLLASDSAGVQHSVNWNNVNGTGVTNTAGSGSNTNVDGPIAGMVVDKTGAATAVTLAFNANGQSAVSSGQALNTGDLKMMNGFLALNAFGDATSNHVDVTLSNIPFALYDAYAYVGTSPFSGQLGSMTLNADGTTTTFASVSAGNFTGFVQATGTDQTSANVSNYFLFLHRSDASLTFTLQSINNGNVGLNGVQLVEAFNPVLAYANNVVVTADSTIDVTGTPSASLGTLSIGSNTLFVTGSSYGTDLPYGLNLGATSVSGGGTTTFDVANNGAGTGTLTLASLTTGGAGRTITKANNGTMEIQGASTINGGSTINVTGGTMRFNNTSGAATIGTGSVATVASGATLELAGSFSALSSSASVTSRVHIINNSTQVSGGGLVVSGTHQQVGAVDGSGDTVVNAGSDLTSNHIVQSALVIGGTAGSPALVTIDASDALGNPIGQSSGLVLAGSLTPSSPFGEGVVSSCNLSSVAGGGSELASLSPSSAVGGGNPSSIPEPSSLLLVLFAITGLAGQGIALRRRARRNDY